MNITMGLRMVGLVALVGIAAGVFLASLTNFLANTNIGGPGWSFRGNGALWVPFGIGPAFLAMGWSALALHCRRARRWERWAGVSLLIGVVVACLGLLSLMLSRLGTGWYMSLSFLPWLWAILAPVLWGLVPVGVEDRERLSWWWYVGAGLVYGVAVVMSFFVAGKLVPA